MTAVQQPENNSAIPWRGRVYSSFAVSNRLSCVPVDEEEEHLQNELNDLLNELLGGTVLPHLLLADLEDPAVLDCGCGKGAWIDSLLGDHSSTELLVTGIDIYLGTGNESDEGEPSEQDGDDDAIEEFIKKRWNLNASFRDEDRSTRLRPETFDLINCRMLADGIDAARWPDFVRELKALLKPRGWLQMVELQLLFQSDRGVETTFLQRWWDCYSDALSRIGKDARVGRRLGQLMTEARFDRVRYTAHQLRIGHWGTDTIPAVAEHTIAIFRTLLQSSSAWLFMQHPGYMTPEQFAFLVQGAQAELESEQLRIYINVHAAYGRKPPRR